MITTRNARDPWVEVTWDLKGDYTAVHTNRFKESSVTIWPSGRVTCHYGNWAAQIEQTSDGYKLVFDDTHVRDRPLKLWFNTALLTKRIQQEQQAAIEATKRADRLKNIRMQAQRSDDNDKKKDT